MPLPSTRLPPHYWATVDKGTHYRVTNQAGLVVDQDQNGNLPPIPVAGSEIYFDFQGAPFSILAKQLINAVENNFSSGILSRLSGVAADGPYQASGFRNQLYEMLFIAEIHDLALPITWDPALLLNLCVNDVRNSKSESAEFFRVFIKRCNVFNHILSHEKGLSFLQMFEEPSLKTVNYAAQRFASSSYNQWLKIERNFSSYRKAFEILHSNRDETKEWQYMICGSDYSRFFRFY